MPKKSKKSENELADGHKERLAHAVETIDKRIAKVEKMATSKKYPTSHEDREKIINYVGEAMTRLDARLSATGTTEAPRFKL